MSIVDDAAHLALVELDDDILQSLKIEEQLKTPSSALVYSQPQIGGEMRQQLLEFLAQAQCALDLLPDTLALAVSVLDRYMSKRVVFARHYQLLGSVCLWLAAKTMDSKARLPTTATLAYLCANTYAESMFSEMELHVLTTLEWNVLAPIASDFIDVSVGEVVRTVATSLSSDDYEKLQSMASFISESALFSHEIIGVRPSTLAASSVALSTLVLDVVEGRQWPSVYPTGCEHECFEALVSLMSNPPKECISRYGGVSEGTAPFYFAEFFVRLADSARTMALLSNKYRQNPLDNLIDLEFSEPCTPVRSRQVSFDSSLPISPYEEGLVSPDATISSPNTYFVPLTPDETCPRERFLSMPTAKNLSFF